MRVIRALHMADYITELNGERAPLAHPKVVRDEEKH